METNKEIIPVENLLPGIAKTMSNGIIKLGSIGRYAVFGLKEGVKDGAKIVNNVYKHL